MSKIFTVIKENLRRDRMMFALRIATGVILSIVAADYFGIDFAPSTGVITLLTIDQTKKDTFHKVALRIGSFIYTYMISWMLLDIFKLETTLGFSIAITLVTFITFLLRWDLTLSVNCVILIQLFLDKKAFTLNLFLNESGRLLIGLLSAILINFIFNTRYDDDEADKSTIATPQNDQAKKDN